MSTLRCVGVAFVVHVERTAAAADGAVVDHGAERAGDLLADAAAEGRDALAIEIGFEAVADGFVQQDAGPAGPEHHGHFAGRRFDRAQLHDGLARGFAGRNVRASFRSGRNRARRVRRRRRSRCCGGAAVFAREHEDAHARHRLAIETEHAVAGGDQHVAQAVGVGGLHLKDARDRRRGRRDRRA